MTQKSTILLKHLTGTTKAPRKSLLENFHYKQQTESKSKLLHFPVESEPHLGQNQADTHENGQSIESTESYAHVMSNEAPACQLFQTHLKGF